MTLKSTLSIIDDYSAFEFRMKPLCVTMQMKASGFYIHMSDGTVSRR